jgi:hypothetical protein
MHCSMLEGPRHPPRGRALADKLDDRLALTNIAPLDEQKRAVGHILEQQALHLDAVLSKAKYASWVYAWIKTSTLVQNCMYV